MTGEHVVPKMEQRPVSCLALLLISVLGEGEKITSHLCRTYCLWLLLSQNVNIFIFI